MNNKPFLSKLRDWYFEEENFNKKECLTCPKCGSIMRKVGYPWEKHAHAAFVKKSPYWKCSSCNMVCTISK